MEFFPYCILSVLKLSSIVMKPILCIAWEKGGAFTIKKNLNFWKLIYEQILSCQNEPKIVSFFKQNPKNKVVLTKAQTIIRSSFSESWKRLRGVHVKKCSRKNLCLFTFQSNTNRLLSDSQCFVVNKCQHVRGGGTRPCAEMGTGIGVL